MRSQFKKQIKEQKRLVKNAMNLQTPTQNQGKMRQAVKFDVCSQQSRVFQIKTTQDYFQQSVGNIADFELFSLKKVFDCFEDVLAD